MLSKEITVLYWQLSLCINVWPLIDKDTNHLFVDMKTQWWNNQCREGTEARRPKLMVVVVFFYYYLETGLKTGGANELGKTPSLYRLFSLRKSIWPESSNIYRAQAVRSSFINSILFSLYVPACPLPSIFAIHLPRSIGGVYGIIPWNLFINILELSFNLLP